VGYASGVLGATLKVVTFQRPCFMTPEEEQLMQRHNEQFQNLSTADILLSTYYVPAPRSQQNFIRAVDLAVVPLPLGQ
jgi:hypothetical protein